MFELKQLPLRLAILKLKNNEDIICNLVLVKGDLLNHGLFRKSSIIDRWTKKECILVLYPVRTIDQVKVENGNIDINTILIRWYHNSSAKVFAIPVEMIVGVSPITDQIHDAYVSFVRGAIPPTQTPKLEEPERKRNEDELH